MLTIGTRGSDLALWQANDLLKKLADIDVQAQLKIIKTQGDRVQHLGFDKLEGKGFFTKEIEEALIDKEIDIAVHSLKDLPTESTPKLAIGGLSERADPSDVLIIHKDHFDSSYILRLKPGSVVGTSAVRRKLQISRFDQNLVIKDIRGNVPTRINKLRTGEYHGIVLASAGVNRLGIDLSEFEHIKFNPIEFIPSPAQGIIAYQCRKDDLNVRRILKDVHHKATGLISNVERKILKLMEGGCQLPLGAYCYQDDQNNFHCSAIFGCKLKC